MTGPSAPATRPGTAPVAPPPAGTPDWPAQTADAIERAVGAVRAKTTGPAITVARGAVYGTFAAIVGVAAAVLLAISAVRALDIAGRELLGPGHTWAAHLVTGVGFTLAGMFAWSKRTSGS
jgi:hypothetical protein